MALDIFGVELFSGIIGIDGDLVNSVCIKDDHEATAELVDQDQTLRV